MSEFLEVETADLFGSALDWAVAQVEGRKTRIYLCPVEGLSRVAVNVPDGDLECAWLPSLDWDQCGCLIEKYRISFEDEDYCFSALMALESPTILVGSAFGETHLIAACRAIVCAKFGDTVRVPKELLQ
jgi:hypothetical protein